MEAKYPCYKEKKDKKGQWYWIYYAKNGEEIARSSESYINLEDCEHSISLINLAEKAYLFLQQHMDAASAEAIIVSDYSNGYKKRDIPPFLKKHISTHLVQSKAQTKLNSRQLQHQ